MRRILTWMLTLVMLLMTVGLFAPAQGLAEELVPSPAAPSAEAPVAKLTAPTITVKADKTAAVKGSTVTFTATAANITGTAKYQWEKSNDGVTWTKTTLTGYNTAKLSFEATAARLAYSYRVAVTDGSGTWYSAGTQVKIAATPVITATANKTAAIAGDTVTFTAVKQNTVGTVKYQWEKSDDGITWTKTTLTGYNTAKLSFEATAARLTYQYRVAVTDANGTWYSAGVKVRLAPKPVITASANKSTAFAGDTVTFTAEALNTVGTVTYRWQKSADGTSWSNVSLTGYNTAKLSFDATSARLSYQYRVAVTDDNGTWYSKGVQVKLIQKPVVTAKADKTSVFIGDTLAYQATVSNTVGTVAYRWQKSADGVSWSNVTLSGYNTAKLSFNVTQPRMEYKYRVAVTDDNGTWYSNGVAVKLIPKPVITAAANKSTAFANDTVSFTASVQDTSGTVKYQWQRSADGVKWSNTSLTGYNTAKLSFTANADRLSYRYRVAVTDANSTWYSAGVQVKLIPKPTVTASANKTTVFAGDTVTFTATPKDTVGTVKYRWQRSADGSTWSNTSLSGYNTAKLSFEATADRLNYRYRVAVTDANGTWYSAGVQVKLIPKPTVTATVNRTAACEDDLVTYTATVKNTVGNVTYQWQRSKDGSNWIITELPGYATKTLSFEATESRLSYRYRLSVTDTNGTWYSNAIKVNLITRPVITAKADKTKAFSGDTVNFTVTTKYTSGTLKYQWQKSADGASWSNVSLTGNKTASLSFEATASRLANQYRVAVTDVNGTWYSAGVSVKFLLKPTVTVTANRLTAAVGDKVTLTATTANLDGKASYQWQYSDDNADWHDSSISGNDTATLSFAATELRLNRYYRLKVTDANGTWYSAPVYIGRQPAIKVSADKTTAYTGETVTFTATTSDTAGTLAYQWQRSKDGVSWSNTQLSGYNTNKLTFDVTQDRLSYSYRVAVTDANGTWYSDGVKVDFRVKPVITIKANRLTAAVGDTVTFTATVTNLSGKASYRWQYSDDNADWHDSSLDGATTTKLSFAATELRLNRYYRLKLTNAGETYYSTPVYIGTQPAITVKVNPTSASEGETVTFTATASNTVGSLTYQWQRSSDGSNWSNVTSLSGYNTATLSFAANEERLSYYYRVAVTDANGTWYSDGKQTAFAKVRKYYALVIGQTYENSSGINTLVSCDDDMEHVAGMLESMNRTDYTVVRKKNLTAAQILTAVRDTFARADDDDVCLFYYSGHGYSNSGNLVGTDNRAVYLSDLRAAMDSVKGDKIILLDSCFSGRMIDNAKGVTPITDAELDLTNRNIINAFASAPKGKSVSGKYYVLTACSATEESWCNKYYGYFTYALLYGSGYNAETGKTISSLYADTNGDKYISLKEAYKYSYTKTNDFQPGRQHVQVYPTDSSFIMWGR